MTRAIENVGFVHRDVLEKISAEIVDAHCHAIGFVDSCSRLSNVHFIKTKVVLLNQFKHESVDVRKPRFLVFERDGGYISNDVKLFCRKQGIRFENSGPYTIQKTGNVWKIWETSVAMATCFLENVRSDKKYWTYDLNMSF